MKNIGIALEDDTVDRLDIVADQTFRPRNNLIRFIVHEWLDVNYPRRPMDPASAAASVHLAEHRRLSGLPEEKARD